MQIKFFCAAIFLFLLIGCSKMQLYYVKNAKMIPFPEVQFGEPIAKPPSMLAYEIEIYLKIGF